MPLNTLCSGALGCGRCAAPPPLLFLRSRTCLVWKMALLQHAWQFVNGIVSVFSTPSTAEPPCPLPETRYRCLHCCHPFTTQGCVDRHQKKCKFIDPKHVPLDPLKFMCTKCENSSSINPYNVQRHVDTFHSSTSGKHTCPCCGAKFEDHKKLATHIRKSHWSKERGTLWKRGFVTFSLDHAESRSESLSTIISDDNVRAYVKQQNMIRCGTRLMVEVENQRPAGQAAVEEIVKALGRS